MRLTDPRETLADESTFIGYLVGFAGVAQLVRTLAAAAADDDRPSGPFRAPDDFVHALLGFASIGAAIERLADLPASRGDHTAQAKPPDSSEARWLR